MQTNSTTSQLGTTALQLPPIIFGSSALGNLYQAIGDEVKREIVSQWFTQSTGVVVADSAGKYGAGLALECMAAALTQLGIDQQDILISNKLGWRRVPLVGSEPTFEPGAWVDLKHDAVQDISYDGMLRCWEQGCELLAPYQPQIVSVHDPDEYLASAVDESDASARWDDLGGAYQALFELKDRGTVSAIGVGSKDWRVSQRLCDTYDLDWVMLATSLTIYEHSQDLLDFVESLRKRNISVINSAVFNSGFLIGEDFFDYRKITGESAEDQSLLKWRAKFHDICARHQVSPAEACVAFGMSPPGVIATALNSSRPGRIAQNVSLVHAKPADAFWSELKNSGLIAEDYPYLAVNDHA
ncbi:Pyridoxal 4-dehydrogenase [Rubripirellula obstinata]|uniref:Pyridoxal 4-dehydrogenase n=1 Tax=Rubripirellula obstinata TaxID=406547 RepID=A0A5B1CLA7_9BACT|nr:aldo/keto reductase [Rubripirellula obstinata]KAA1261122.1 Pyridoxal 4-dehydrogenase [Rubripirellula obstinata]